MSVTTFTMAFPGHHIVSNCTRVIHQLRTTSCCMNPKNILITTVQIPGVCMMNNGNIKKEAHTFSMNLEIRNQISTDMIPQINMELSKMISNSQETAVYCLLFSSFYLSSW